MTQNNLFQYYTGPAKKGLSQREKIKEMLDWGDWICSSDIIQRMFPIIDYRKRISEIKEKLPPYRQLESEPCRGRCGRNHTANLHRYRII